MAVASLGFFMQEELGSGEQVKENEKNKVITRVIMLAQCAWTLEKDRGKENHFFSNTVYQLLNLFLPEVFLPSAKGKTAANEKISIKLCRAKGKPVLRSIDSQIYFQIFQSRSSLPQLGLPSPCSLYLWICFCFVYLFVSQFQSPHIVNL